MGTTTIFRNFTLQGNLESISNLRCVAFSDYDSSIGGTTRKITIAGYPQIQFVSPTPSNNSGLLVNHFLSNFTIEEQNLNQVGFNFNGKNYTFDANFLELFYFSRFSEK